VAGPLPHRLALRVYYEDTDAGGIVYHASYLRFAERARTEMLRELGFDHTTLLREHGILFVVRRCTAEFLTPARLDDLLEVETAPIKLGGARLVLRQTVLRADRPIVELEVELALLSPELRPPRLPAALARLLAG
jgi:acyl-CoA thioester hydrolase